MYTIITTNIISGKIAKEVFDIMFETGEDAAKIVKDKGELYKDAKLGNFGVTDHGFFYDIEFDEPISSDDLPKIQTKVQELVAANLKISVNSKSTEEVTAYFVEKGQPYKRELLDEVSTKKIEVVTIGDNQFMDVTAGALDVSTATLQHVSLMDVSGAYWKGDDKRAMLTRITGACFDTQSALEDYLEFRAEQLRRDHRVLGKKLGFFMVDSDFGSGAYFWTPKGRYIRDILKHTLKKRMVQFGVELVETPLIGSLTENNSTFQPVSEQIVARNIADGDDKLMLVRQQVLGQQLIMFAHKERSYRELPWKVGEIAKVVRFEKVSELEGLHRSREFTQDNTTIVCTREQVEKELDTLLSMVVQFARDLGFGDFEISYRLPAAISKSQKTDFPWIATMLKGISRKQTITINEEITERQVKEPEIVLKVKDSLRQHRELSKIQILLGIPVEHNLSFIGSDGESHVPVAIRATLSGSLERIIATLIEHYAGMLPLWLTYEHARVIPVTSKQEIYAEKVAKQLSERGIRATIDLDSEPLEGKIKQAEEEKVPYMLIVGEKEQNTNGISVRVQGHGDIGLLDIESFIKDIQGEMVSKSIKSVLV